ncbi:MAG: hypothetical protein KBE09_00305 [Candidatus Pacebacteria bacterium]|nr:hypothetical protein [Candidatus Paceibacterota bacterium]
MSRMEEKGSAPKTTMFGPAGSAAAGNSTNATARNRMTPEADAARRAAVYTG